MAELMHTPRSIAIKPEGVEILWADQHRTMLGHRYLRGHCGCAHCVDEITHVRRIGIGEVDPNVRAEEYMDVGNYAITILWSDLHYQGIYPFKLLRALCQCDECEARRKQQAQHA